VTTVHVVGGGLAGSEAALQLAARGIPVVLHEMRPVRPSPAHRTGNLAELVCSNSLKSIDPLTASGCLKAELDLLGCRLLGLARRASVPAGAALAVDPGAFSALVEAEVAASCLITLDRTEEEDLRAEAGKILVICTGPLTTPVLQDRIATAAGRPGLHFFDAIAPTVTRESLDLEVIYRAARYGRGDADYLNIPLDQESYATLVADLLEAERITVRDFDRELLFDGCQPIEEIAASGPMTMAFGPLRPVGLEDPRTGVRPYAVVQLRQENREGTLFGLVGFQTRIKHPAQKAILRKLPGLARAEFVRLGQMHRNFYLDTPRVLTPNFRLPARPDVFFAGQITGVEGYVESIASGLWTALQVASGLAGRELPPLPPETVCGSLLSGFLFDSTSARFAPMNANFGLLPAVAGKHRGRKVRKEAKARRAYDAMTAWVGGLDDTLGGLRKD